LVFGSGGGGGISPPLPQHFSFPSAFGSMPETDWGVQENRIALRKTVNNIKCIFLILLLLKIRQ